MHHYSDRYLKHCMDLGILTDSPIRPYPLRSANLAMVLKAYAIVGHLPYTVDPHSFSILDSYKVYLTDDGWRWLHATFQSHTFPYLRQVFQFVFSQATSEDVAKESYKGYSNFRGLSGDVPKAGTKQAAVIVRRYGPHQRLIKEFHYKSILEARQALVDLTRYYPVEEFTLYRIRTQMKKGKSQTYRSEIPLLIKESKRGVYTPLRKNP